jgi:hypothetical protein
MKKQLFALLTIFSLTISCTSLGQTTAPETKHRGWATMQNIVRDVLGVASMIYLMRLPKEKKQSWLASLDQSQVVASYVLQVPQAVLVYKLLISNLLIDNEQKSQTTESAFAKRIRNLKNIINASGIIAASYLALKPLAEVYYKSENRLDNVARLTKYVFFALHFYDSIEVQKDNT